MDQSRQECNANMRDDLPGWHPGEPDPRAFHSHPRDNVPHFQESDGGQRMRGAMHGRGLLSNPNSFPSYPPGFENSRISPPGVDNGHRNAPGFDNNTRRRRSGFDNSHGEMILQESLEITSDRPSLPRRRAPSGGSNATNSSNQIPRGDDQVEFCDPSLSHPASVPGKVCDETSEAGLSGLLAKEKTRKKKKLGAGDAQPAQISSTASNDYERATKACQKLWKDLDCAIQRRVRDLMEKEASFTPSTVNKEVLEEDKKQTSAMKNEIMEERRRLEDEVHRLRKEKEALERINTELAVEMVELKQVWRQLEKEKADLLARKAELSAKER